MFLKKMEFRQNIARIRSRKKTQIQAKDCGIDVIFVKGSQKKEKKKKQDFHRRIAKKTGFSFKELGEKSRKKQKFRQKISRNTFRQKIPRKMQILSKNREKNANLIFF